MPSGIGSVLGLVGPVSVYCDSVRWKVWSATSISVWQHVKLSEQIRPWDTLACCWDVKQIRPWDTLACCWDVKQIRPWDTLACCWDVKQIRPWDTLACCWDVKQIRPWDTLACCWDVKQIRPWDTLACCWDVKQPTNKVHGGRRQDASVQWAYCKVLGQRKGKVEKEEKGGEGVYLVGVRVIVSPSHCVPVPLCPRPIVPPSHCAPVPLCPWTVQNFYDLERKCQISAFLEVFWKRLPVLLLLLLFFTVIWNSVQLRTSLCKSLSNKQFLRRIFWECKGAS